MNYLWKRILPKNKKIIRKELSRAKSPYKKEDRKTKLNKHSDALTLIRDEYKKADIMMMMISDMEKVIITKHNNDIIGKK